MARLYPPIIEEVLPAFCLNYSPNNEKENAAININFNLNRAVANTEIKDIVLRLRTISTNKYVITENIVEGHATSYNLITGTCSFQITSSNSEEALQELRIGQYYKAQIAFIDLNNTVGYWSTVGTIKCVAKPTVRIANFNANDVNIFSNEIVGEYIQNTSTGDSSEKVYSYQFQLSDADNNIIIDTGTLLHNSSGDIASNSSIDKFYCYEELNDNETYYLQYIITTINGLMVSSPRYQLINIDSIPLEKDIKLIVETGLEENYNFNNSNWAPWEDGVVRLRLDYHNSEDSFIMTGNFIILRSSSKDNFKSWLEIKRFRLVKAKPTETIFYDYTVEQGITYKYAIQQYNKQGFYSKKIEAENTVVADFEDMFLYDGERQLKIRFNPKISSFKNDLQEQKIDTIGSKHPFIFRNGNVCYKEFPIAGLISFQEDPANFFIQDDDYKQMNLSRFDIPSDERQLRFSKYDEENEVQEKTDIYRGTVYNKTDLTPENIMSERYFKLLVLDWLTDGKPKLFRSPTEGNYIVRLLNVNLTPKAELGRMIHEFTCTAYEVADFNYNSLIDLGLLTSVVEDENEITWSSKMLTDLTKNDNGEYLLNLENKELLHFSCTNFKPGDRIIINFPNTAETLDVIIGTTGTYNYENSQPIAGLKIIPINPNDINFARNILLQTKEYNYQEFDTIASVSSVTQMGEQIIGPVDNFFEHTVVNSTNNLKDYGLSNNVSLNESYQEVNLSLDTYLPNKYFLKNENDHYVLCGEEDFNINNTYYERLFDGDKLRVSEILHLHVKRRELIPIYAYYINDNIRNNAYMNLLDNDIQFSLTPYGQGYVQYKTIASNSEENTNWPGLGFFSEEERQRAMSIGEIVSFVTERLKLDNFCLFQAYIPFTPRSTQKTDWYPYAIKYPVEYTQGGFRSYWIYDPLIRNRTNETGLGDWWPLTLGPYNPLFSIEYEDGKKHEYYLDDKDEVTLQNIALPEKLSFGTGVIAEIIYRIQYIDYAIENTNEQVKTLKNIYLQTKQEAIQNVAKYRSILYNKSAGLILYDKYSKLLVKAKDANQYNNIIKLLTSQAHDAQQSKLTNFLTNKFRLINNIMLQVQQLDMNLVDLIGNDYVNSRYRIFATGENEFGNELKLLQNDFNNYYSEHKNDTIYSLDAIANMNNNHLMNQQEILKTVRDQISDYILSYGNIIDALSECVNRITNGKNYTIDSLNALGSKTYVGQYIELLQNEGKELFFNPVIIDDIEMPLYKILYIKDNDINVLKNISILSDLWEEYLNLDLYPFLSLLPGSNGQYEVAGLDYYEDNTNLNENSYIYANNRIEDIEQALTTLNEYPISGSTANEILDKYNSKYGNYISNLNIENSGLYFSTSTNSSEIKLGDINDDGDINYSWLEQHIDEILARDGNNNFIEFNALINKLNEQNQFNTIPSPDEADGTVQLKQHIINLINYYMYYAIDEITLKDIFQQAYICKIYKDEHIDDLTKDQLIIITQTIQNFKEQMNTMKARIKEDTNFDFDEEQTDIINALINWGKDYNSVIISQSGETVDYTTDITEKINNFNRIIDIKNKAISRFNELKNNILSIQENDTISVSDNIKTVLQEQRALYTDAETELISIKDQFVRQITLLNNNVYEEGYFDFLQGYLDNLSNKYVDSNNLYLQQLAKAEEMKNAYLDEENSYIKQQEKVTNAWKSFLSALSDAYKTEVKERFN